MTRDSNVDRRIRAVGWTSSGPWWLVFDDPGVFFRMWSVPVHRWLLSSVHRPMLDAAACRATRAAKSAPVASEVRKATEAKGDKLDDPRPGPGKGQSQRCRPGHSMAVFSTFLASSLVHEAVLRVALRGPAFPLNTIILTMAGIVIPLWDVAFPRLNRAAEAVNDGGVRVTSPFGTRGTTAAILFTTLEQLLSLTVHVVGWTWWRELRKRNLAL